MWVETNRMLDRMASDPRSERKRARDGCRTGCRRASQLRTSGETTARVVCHINKPRRWGAARLIRDQPTCVDAANYVTTFSEDAPPSVAANRYAGHAASRDLDQRDLGSDRSRGSDDGGRSINPKAFEQRPETSLSNHSSCTRRHVDGG